MNIIRLFLVSLLLINYLSCAHDPVHNQTINLLKSGQYEIAFGRVEHLLLPYNEQAIKYANLFKKDFSESLPHILNHYKKEINYINSNTKFKLILLPNKLKRLSELELISKQDYNDLINELNKTAEEGNRNNSLKFLITDNYKNIKSLNEGDNELIIFRRSVDCLSQDIFPKDTLDNLAIEILRVVEKKGVDSEHYFYLKDKLEHTKLARSILEREATQSLYPEVVSKRLNEFKFDIALKSLPAGEPFLYDLAEYLEKKESLHIVDTISPETYVLKIKKLRFNEHRIPERTETTTYDTYQVNLVGAVLLMPKNATYLFDRTTGGYEISYSFLVQLYKNEILLVSEKISGQEKKEYSFCNNARIRNVFGGVSPATFVANPHMQSMCTSDTKSVDTEEVYANVIKALGSRIITMHPIYDRVNYGICNDNAMPQ
jgi:hypothetical protein